MKRILCALVALLTFLAPSVVFAHGNGHGGRGHDPTELCSRFIAKADSDMPMLHPKWQEIKTVKFGFTYVFYHDSTRPELAVAAMIVIGTIPDTNATLTRVTWQVGEEIRSVRAELDELVCVKSIFGKDDRKYDLEGLMKRLEKKEEGK